MNVEDEFEDYFDTEKAEEYAPKDVFKNTIDKILNKNIENNLDNRINRNPEKKIESKLKNKIQRVIWNPKHRPESTQFFLYEMYCEKLAKEKLSRLASYSYGFSEIEFDFSKLNEFQFGLSKAVGVLPDGTPFDIQDVDAMPNFITISTELFSKKDELKIYLALPINQEEMSFEHHFTSDRFTQDEIEFESEKQPIALHKFVLITDNVNLQNYSYLPVLHLKFDKNTLNMLVQEKFIPPMLNLLKSTQGKKKIEGIHERIKNKIFKIRDMYISLNRAKDNLVSANVIDALTLQLLNQFDGYFKSILNQESLQPYQFYQKLISMTAELATYASKSKLNIHYLPYNHENFVLNIDDIFNEFKKQLAFSLEYDAYKVQLHRNEHGTFNTEFIPSKEFENIDCIVALYSSANNEDMRNHLPNQSKIASPSEIYYHVTNMMAGIRIEPILVIPNCVPYYHNYVYFKMTHTIKSKGAWEEVYKENAVSFHFSGHYPNLEAHLWLVKIGR